MNIKDQIHKYRRPLIILVHLIFIIASYVLAFYLRFELALPKEYVAIISKTLAILIVIKLIIFYYFGLFQGLWRYVSTEDLWGILKANTIATILFIPSVIFTIGLNGYPRSVFILDWIICTALVGGVRFVTRLLRENRRRRTHQKKKRVLIVGAGEAGIMMLKEYRNNPAMGVEVVGFVDDDPLKKNLKIRGTQILGYSKNIGEIVESYDVDEIILAIPSASGEAKRKILSYCQIAGVNVKIIPGIYKLLSGELETKPRQVKPEDLLGRETVNIDKEEISSYIKGKRILVTGAGGTIGSELCRQISIFSPQEIILLDHNENNVYFLIVELKNRYPKINFRTIIGDIKDIGLLQFVFSQYKPQTVFHAAAHKHVPLMEENVEAAVKNNVIGSRNLIYAAWHYKSDRFVLISTDKAVNPTSVMGATKRIAEMILQAKARNCKTKFMAVRFGNVIGSDGSVVPLFKKQIEEGGPVTITHPEARRYFMSVSEAVQLVLQAGAIGKGGEIFILDMGEQIKILDLATQLISLSGLAPNKDILIKFIGLRPGEKLFEETLLDTEKDKATRYDKIFIAQPHDFNVIKIRKEIKELERLANTMQEDRIIDEIRKIVPEYTPIKGGLNHGKTKH
jgi:FlaA1/EpsC-like NDP-sugar epimerase